jgi:hypothetical protein
MHFERCGNVRGQKPQAKGNGEGNYKEEFMRIDTTNVEHDMYVQAISEATGIVTKVIKKNLEGIWGKYSIDSVQKKAILGTSHTMRKVLQADVLGLSGRDIRWFKR